MRWTCSVVSVDCGRGREVRPVCLSSPCVVVLVPGMKQARAGQSLNRKIQLSWEYQWSFDAFVQFTSGSGGGRGFDGRGGH